MNWNFPIFLNKYWEKVVVSHQFFFITFPISPHYFNIEYSIWAGIYCSKTAPWTPERSINTKINQPILMIHNQSALLNSCWSCTDWPHCIGLVEVCQPSESWANS